MPPQPFEYWIETVWVVRDGPAGEVARVNEIAKAEWLAKLNQLGADGWELVAADRRDNIDLHRGGWCRYEGTFKRALPAGSN